MPTAAKLVAAIAFGLVAFIAAHLFIPALPEGTQTRGFRELSAGVGVLCGWLVMGGLVGRGYYAALGSGVRTSMTILFFCLLGFSVREMLKRSMQQIYDGPMEAVVAIFDVMLYYGKMMGTPNMPLALLIGGFAGGFAAEWAGRRWR